MPSSLNGEYARHAGPPLPVHASRIVRAVFPLRPLTKSPARLTRIPRPLLSFFLPRTIRLPSTSGFLARRIYGGRSRARFPSLAEKPTEYLLLRMEKFLPLSPLIHVRGRFSRTGFASSLPTSPFPNTNRPNENCLSPPDIVESYYHCSG